MTLLLLRKEEKRKELLSIFYLFRMHYIMLLVHKPWIRENHVIYFAYPISSVNIILLKKYSINNDPNILKEKTNMNRLSNK